MRREPNEQREQERRQWQLNFQRDLEAQQQQRDLKILEIKHRGKMKGNYMLTKGNHSIQF